MGRALANLVVPTAVALIAGCDILSALGGGQGLPCDDDQACSSGSICFGGHCTQAECAGDDQCPSGSICTRGRCSPWPRDAAIDLDGSLLPDARCDAAADAPWSDAWQRDSGPDGAGDTGPHADATAHGDLGVQPDARRSDRSGTDFTPLATDATVADGHLVTPPTVTITPPDGSRGVTSDQRVILDFSEPMNQASVESAFSFTSESGPVSGSWSWSSQQAMFTPSVMAPGSSHKALLAGTCRDAEGDLLAGLGGADCAAPDQCSTFVVSDGIAPTVTLSPADGSANLPPLQNITLTFSEAMDQASVAVSISVDGDVEVCTLNWSSARVASCAQRDYGCSNTVTVSILDGARDPSGLALLDTCAVVPWTAYCGSFTTRSTHEECDQCSDGCWDVRTAEHGCPCVAEMAAPGDSPPCKGASWCLGCGTCAGSYDCICAYHCHYQREERFQVCNCHQVCS